MGKIHGGIGQERAESIAIDTAGNVYTTGIFLGEADFDPGPGVYNLTSAGESDIFVHKISQNPGTGIAIEELQTAGISVYPNPVDDVVIINSEKMEIDEIKIFDVNGKLIKHEIINSNNTELDVKDLNAGIYFIGINTHRIKIVKK